MREGRLRRFHYVHRRPVEAPVQRSEKLEVREGEEVDQKSLGRPCCGGV